jgi:hypothetical protein
MELSKIEYETKKMSPLSLLARTTNIQVALTATPGMHHIARNKTLLTQMKGLASRTSLTRCASTHTLTSAVI